MILEVDAYLMDTNNKWGWLHYYLAYLIVRCGMRNKMDAISYLPKAVAQAEEALRTGKTRDLADNQCIMLSNRWFYHHEPGETAVECQGETHRFDIAALNWWINYLKS